MTCEFNFHLPGQTLNEGVGLMALITLCIWLLVILAARFSGGQSDD